jgi:hypothetical protein
MKQNYRTKLGLGYEDAKFNYLKYNNSQFSCFLYFIYIHIVKKKTTTSHLNILLLVKKGKDGKNGKL